MQANGGPTPAQSHGGSGGTSPAAGYSLQADRPGSYEPDGRPMDQRPMSGGYGSPLDLPRTNHSDASELSTGITLAPGSMVLSDHLMFMRNIQESSTICKEENA